MKEKAFISLIAYVRNNEAHIENFLREVDRFMCSRFETYEVILVNDNSQDGTVAKIKETVQETNGKVVVLNLSRAHGLEAAMMAGLDKSMGDFLIEIDSIHMDYPLEILGQLYYIATTGVDIVSASPNKVGFNSNLFYKFINKVSNFQDLYLTTERVRIVSRRAYNAMTQLKERVRYRKALYLLSGYRHEKISYNAIKQSNLYRRINRENIRQAIDVFVIFSTFGLRTGHLLSILFFLFSISMIIYSLYNYFFNQNIVEGWTTIMIMLSMGFAGVFFILGMIGEYIARILTEVQQRPVYSMHSVEIFREKSAKDQMDHIKKEKGIS